MVPNSTLAELAALEAMFKTLASDKEERLHVGQLLVPLKHQLAAAYKELKTHQQQQQQGVLAGADAAQGHPQQQVKKEAAEDAEMADAGVEQVGA